MISALAHGSRRKAAMTYTLRGMVYSSALWPIMTVGALIVAECWTRRNAWHAPHIRYGEHRTRARARRTT